MTQENLTVPQGWTEASLSELVELNPKHDADLPEDTAVSFVPMSAVDDVDGVIKEHDSRPLGAVKKGYTHFAEGDVIFAKITPCMENGKSAVARGLVNGLACGSTEFFVLRSRGAIKPDYLHKFLRQQSYRRAAEHAMTSAVGQARVPKEFLLNTTVPLAPINEQDRIVAKLEDSFDRVRSCREHLELIPNLLKQFRQSILDAACSGRLTKDWRGESVSDGLPPGWQWVQLEDLLIKGGIFDGPFGSNLKTDDYTSEGVRVIRLENIGHLSFIHEKKTYISQGKYESLIKHKVGEGDIIFASFIDEEIRACVLPKLETDAIAKADCFCLRPDEKLVDRTYLTYQLVCRDTYNALTGNIHGATRPRINTTQLRKLKVRVCPLEEQEEIVRRVESLFKIADTVKGHYRKAQEQLDKLPQSILAKAFRGDLVPQNPNDEPASALLERIRAGKADGDKATRKAKQPQRKAVRQPAARLPFAKSAEG